MNKNPFANYEHRRMVKKASAMLHFYSPVLSDEDCKNIVGDDIQDIAASIIENGPPYSKHEIQVLIKAANFNDDFDYNDESVLQQYAQHIRNYRYTYKDEAQDVDPRIDTAEEHIGPMAQDIEKVNPAAVKEDKSGYKVVDTGRLALMNAGAIGELARAVEELKHG